MFENDTNFLDQHFLIDEDIINLIINKSDIKKDDIVLEVGPGKGVLTRRLSPLCKQLLVVEKDIKLISFLAGIDNALVTYKDILDYDIPEVNKIVTSLPYSITEPFLYKLIDVKFDSLTMLCGKKLYDNIINKTKLGVLVSSYYKVEYISDVVPSSFDNPPRVMSCILKLVPLNIRNLNKKEKIIRLLYKYRYMKVKNALKEILIKLDNITQRDSRDIVDTFNIDEKILNKLFDELSNEEVSELFDKIR